MYKYTGKNAQTYSQLGIEGTTYQPGFDEVRKILDDLTGKKVLDFGSGTGRTAQLLLSLGADEVVGVDHNKSMVEEAVKLEIDNLKFINISEQIPFDDNIFDAALCAHVFVEVGSIEEMEQLSKEVFRVLKKDGVFVIITNNPEAIGREYLSFGYKKTTDLKSGDKIACLIKKGDDSFEIDDYYWEEGDYQKVLEKVGFRIDSMTYPMVEGEKWLDEAKVAPHVVIKAVK